MATVSDYRRPSTIEDALALLAHPGAVAVGGGTTVNASPSDGPVEVVDLQALGLHGIEKLETGGVRIWATTTLQALVDDELVPEVVREASRRESPSTLRAASTIGGRVAAADGESELLAALLVHEALVGLVGPREARELPLAMLLADRGVIAGSIVVAVTIATGGDASFARTGRTKADRAIVSAFARRTPAGRRLLALSGVAKTPLVVDGPAEIAGLVPPGDFRGSAGYRRALAATLAARALKGLG